MEVTNATIVVNEVAASVERVPAIIVTWFIARGFGFAHAVHNSKIIRYFIHISECSKRPKEGDLVLLTPAEGRNGCKEPVGVNVIVQGIDAPVQVSAS
jgi:hypothetical protein